MFLLIILKNRFDLYKISAKNMKEENILTITIDGKEYNIVLSNISDALYDDNLLENDNYADKFIMIISNYAKYGTVSFSESIDDILEKLPTLIDKEDSSISSILYLFGLSYEDMFSDLWFRLRLEYEWMSWNNGLSVKKQSIKNFQERLIRYKFRDNERGNVRSINSVRNFDLIQTKEFPNWEIMVGYPITNYFNPMFSSILRKDFITISLQKTSSQFAKGKEEGDSSFSLYKEIKTFFNYYVEKIDDEGINTYLNDKKIPYILKCVYRDGYIYYVDTWLFCILNGINIINGPMMDNDDTYKRLVEPTINVSSYYIEESF